jgi:hypothetical protein
MLQKILVTRNELRIMGFNVSNTTFNRWEVEGLRTYKAPGRSAIVRYRIRDFLNFMGPRRK